MPKANPNKGEALLGQHLLRMDFNSCRAFEAESGRKFPLLLLDMQEGLGVTEAADWLRAFMVEDVSLERAWEIVDEEGYPETVQALANALDGFMAPKKGKAENPPKAE